MRRKLFTAGVILCLGCLFFAACGGEGNSADKKNPSVDIVNEVATLEQGDVYLLEAKLTDLTGEIVWSSDNEGVLAVDQSGKLTALGAGDATVTATVGTLSDSVTISVSNEYEPLLHANEPLDVVMYKGTEYSPAPSVTYKGNAVTDEIEYVYTIDNESVATVTNGRITAVGEGSCVVEISAEYRFFEIYAAFKLTVIPHEYLSLDKEEILLSTLETGGVLETERIAATMVIDGNAVQDAEIVWSSEDESVATVVDGQVVAVGAGETAIKASYEVDGQSFASVCSVKVRRPVFETGLSFDYEISKEIRLPDYEISDFAEENIRQIFLKDVNVLGADGKIDKNLCIGSPEAKELTIVTQRAEYCVSVTVYNAIVDSKEVMASISDRLAKLPASSDPASGYYLDGYVVFAADIEYNGAYDGIANAEDCEKEAPTVNGFKGLIDGRNYTVSGLRLVTEGAAFVSTLNGGTVKNISFVDAYCNGRRTAVVASNAASATFENVYAQGSVDTSLALANNNQSRGLFAAKICNGQVKFIGCVAELAQDFNAAAYTAAFGFMHSYGAANFFSGCAVIGTSTIYGHCDPANYNYTTFTVVDEKEGVLLCDSYQAYMQTSGYELDESASKAADCTTAGYSIFKKSQAEDIRIVVAALGHDWQGTGTDKECDRCHVISKIVSAECDVEGGFDFSTYRPSSELVSLTKGFDAVDHEDGKISFVKTDASDKAVEYTAVFADGSTFVVRLTVWSLLIDNEAELRSMKNYVWSEMRYKWGDSLPTQAQITANQYDYAYFGYFKVNASFTVTGNWTSEDVVVGKEALTGSTYVNHTNYCSPLMGFRGVFDGGNNTITGLTFSGNYTSLFGVIGNAEIRNVTFKDVTLSKAVYTTAIFGHYVSGGTVSNVTVEVKILDGTKGYNLEPSGIIFGYFAPLRGSGYYAGVTFNSVSVTVVKEGTVGANLYVFGGFQNAYADWTKITCTDVTVKGYDKLLGYGAGADVRTTHSGVTVEG